MKFAAAHQPSGYISRLQQRALGWKVGCQISRDGNECARPGRNCPTRETAARPPRAFGKGVKAGILTQERVRERRDQCFG
jgi:hypothetical protein